MNFYTIFIKTLNKNFYFMFITVPVFYIYFPFKHLNSRHSCGNTQSRCCQ